LGKLPYYAPPHYEVLIVPENNFKKVHEHQQDLNNLKKMPNKQPGIHALHLKLPAKNPIEMANLPPKQYGDQALHMKVPAEQDVVPVPEKHADYAVNKVPTFAKTKNG